MSAGAEALYLPDDGIFVPTPRTARPWDDRGQHGAPVAALVARSFEALVPPEEMQLARLSIDLLRPVPMTPLEVRAGIHRRGRAVAHVSGAVFAGGVEVARASGALLRTAELALPDEAMADDLPPSTPEAGELARTGEHGFNATGCELRMTEGGLHLRGPGAGWMRLRVPVVLGEETSAAMAAVAAADLGNGFSSMLSLRRWRYMSTDLTVHLLRPPVGPWIGLRARTRLGRWGTGVADSALYDRTGFVGRASQTLLVEAVGS